MAKASSSLVDPSVSPTKEFYQNPYPAFEKLRNESPVFWMKVFLQTLSEKRQAPPLVLVLRKKAK